MIGFKNDCKTINVYGDCGGYIGFAMTGGKLILNGDYRHFSSSFINGDIYHKDKALILNGIEQEGANLDWYLPSDREMKLKNLKC